MKYLILKPTKPFDPRTLKLQTTTDLHAVMPPVIECETEREAVERVRRIIPDGAAMPCPLKIGAVEVVLLGLVDDPERQVSADSEIPFALCVQAISQNSGDTYQLKKNPRAIFEAALWRIPPIRPELAEEVNVEVRGTDLSLPIFTTARIGADRHGRSTIYVDIGGISVSITLTDELLQVRR